MYVLNSSNGNNSELISLSLHFSVFIGYFPGKCALASRK